MRKIALIAKNVIIELFRRKDIYLIFALLLVIIFYSAQTSFGGQTNFQRYFKEIAITLSYAFSVIIAVTFAARQLPQEMEAKTIYTVLAHPISKTEFIAGKYLGTLLISAISFSLFYATFIISIYLRGDFSTPPVLLVQGYVLHLFLLSFFTSLAILLSLYLSPTANAGISLILYFATNWFGATLPGYIFLPHPELFDIKEKIIHSWDTVPVWAMAFLFIYAAVYSLIFILAASLDFKRRNL